MEINKTPALTTFNVSAIPKLLLGSRKKIPTTYTIVRLFSRLFNKNVKFLKNSPYDFYKLWHSHSTLKGTHAYTMASKLYDWPKSEKQSQN